MNNTAENPTTFFSDTYKSAREKFLASAEKAGAQISSITHPTQTGREGETLAMDFAVLGPANADTALVLVSATHGVEGFCGSGVQTGLLASGELDQIAQTTKVIIVHGHNPYGFSWLRRVNEDNVDLNRNYIDHSRPYPDNKAYEELRLAIAPEAMTGDPLETANAKLRAYVEKNGAFALQEAVSRGQYRFPEGLYFGGNFQTWSNRTLTTKLREVCAGSSRIGVLDFHTGLGPYGHGEIICELPTGSEAESRLSTWFDGDFASTTAGTSVSADLVGTLDSALPHILAPAEVTACAIEFGTVRTEAVFFALRADNWLHLHGKLDAPEGAQIKSDIRDAFYQDKDDWKALIWQRSLWAINCMAGGLSKR